MVRASVRAANAADVDSDVARPLDEAALGDPAWGAAAALAGDTALFQSPAWTPHALARDRKAGLEPVLLRLDDGSRPALLPLSIAREYGTKVARALGEPLAQYGDAIGAGVSAPRLRAGLDALRHRFGVDLFVLRRVRDDAAITPALDQLEALRCDPSEAPWLALSPDGPQPLAGGGESHALKDARRLRRRLERRHAAAFDVLRSSPEASDAMRQAIAWKRDWLRERGIPARLLTDATLADALVEIVQDPAVETRIGVLRLDGAAVAIDAGFVFGGRLYGYLIAYDPEFRSRGVGKVVMADMASWAGGAGLQSYDHLPPADPYKAEWTDRAHPVSDRILPLTPVGWLRARVFDAGLKPALKDAALRGLKRSRENGGASPAKA